MFKMFKVVFLVSIVMLFTACFENIETRGGLQGKISLTLQDELGLSLEGTKIFVKGTNQNVFTDKSGNFYIKNLETKRYTISISREKFITKEVDVEIEKGKMINLVDTLVYKYGLVKGNIKYGEGSIQTAKVEIRNISGSSIDIRNVNEIGIFSFNNLEIGDINLVITSPGNKIYNKPLRIEAGKILDLAIISLTTNVGTIRGVVVPEYADVMGKRLNDIQIFVDEVFIQYSNSNGGFELKNIEEGEHSLRFEKEGYKSTSTTVSVIALILKEINISMKMEYKDPNISLQYLNSINSNPKNFYSLYSGGNNSDLIMGVNFSQLCFINSYNNYVYPANSYSIDYTINGVIYEGDQLNKLNLFMLLSGDNGLSFGIATNGNIDLSDKYKYPLGFTKNNEYAYVVASSVVNNSNKSDYKNSRLFIIDIKNKDKLEIISSIDIATAYNNILAPGLEQRCVAVADKNLYISNGLNMNTSTGGIMVFDISRPENPIYKTTLFKDYYVSDLKIKNGELYFVSCDINKIKNNNESIKFGVPSSDSIKYSIKYYDISKPENPVIDDELELDLPYEQNLLYDSGLKTINDPHMNIENNTIFVYAGKKLNIIYRGNDKSLIGVKNLTLTTKEFISGITSNSNRIFIACGVEIKILNSSFLFDISTIDNSNINCSIFNRKICKLGKNIIYVDDIEGIKVFAFDSMDIKENYLIEDEIKKIIDENKPQGFDGMINKILAINVFENKLYIRTINEYISINIDTKDYVSVSKRMNLTKNNSYYGQLEIGNTYSLSYSIYSNIIDLFNIDIGAVYQLEKEFKDVSVCIVDDYIYWYTGYNLSYVNSKGSFESLIAFDDYKSQDTNGEIKSVYKNDFLYLSNYNSDIIKIISIKDRNFPKLIKTVETGVKNISSLVVDDTTLYIGDEGDENNRAITAVDIRNPYDAKVAKRSSKAGIVYALTVDDKYIYSLMNKDGLVIFEK